MTNNDKAEWLLFEKRTFDAIGGSGITKRVLDLINDLPMHPKLSQIYEFLGRMSYIAEISQSDESVHYEIIIGRHNERLFLTSLRLANESKRGEA